MCDVCKQSIEIIPDFASSGVWCSHCGICHGNPKETFPDIPSELFDRVEFWNDVWVMASSNPLYATEKIESWIIEMGEDLSYTLNEYIHCLYFSKKSRIFKNSKKA